MSLRPMTKKNETETLVPKKSGIKLGTSIKTATVEQVNMNFVTWKDLENGQSIVFELNDGEFRQTVSPKNKNHVFENFYTWKIIVVDADEEVLRVVEAKDADNLIQVPCQASHRQGIKDLIELNESVAIYKNMRTNVKDGNTYYNCEVGSLVLENLDAYEA